MASLAVMKGVPFTEKRLAQWLKEDGGVVVQTKRDEIRCVVEVLPCEEVHSQHEIGVCHPSGKAVRFTSASGKPLYNMDIFAEDFIFLSGKYGLDKFDCGVMVNDSFDVTRSVVRSSKKPYNLKSDEYRACFYLYDLPTSCASTYEGRRQTMAAMALESEWFSTPETYVIDDSCGQPANSAVVQELYTEMLEAGHEGAMLKRLDFQYQPKRTTDWMKMKPEEEADGVIIGYNPGVGKYAGMVGSVNVRFADGSKTAVSGMTDAVRQALTVEPIYYVGKVLEVRYMMRDSQGGYRHPRWYRLHPDKDEL